MYLVPRSLGAQVDLLRLAPEQQWRPDFVELKSMVTEGAEFLALTHPNPTGSTISSEELEAAVEIRQSAGVRLVSDETYGLMTEREPLPPAACADPTAVSLSTMSRRSASRAFASGGSPPATPI
jgi:aspartate/methionine/tyrosine aminotransferase